MERKSRHSPSKTGVTALIALAGVLLSLVVVCPVGRAAAFDFTVSGPIVHGNLAVYPIEDGGPGGPALLTLDQAARQGAARVHEPDKGPVEVENLSGRGIFLQAGTLLAGGLQDQVVRADTIVPPRSGRVPIDTYCVDPFRSAPRAGADPKLFTATGALFPWNPARLSLMIDAPDSKPVGTLRQSAVWWSIDTLRARLAQRLGEPMEPARIPQWSRDAGREVRARVQLAERQSTWTTGLPLALENRRLAQAQRPYVDAVRAAGRRGEVVGAVFAINGRFHAAEVYASHDLFRRMWPALSRAYATEAIALDEGTALPAPSAAAAKAFLEAAPAGREPELAGHGSAAPMQSETIGDDGAWVHRSVVARLDPAAAARTPDALAVRLLETGFVNGLAGDGVVLRRDPQDQWIVEIPGSPVQAERSDQPDRSIARIAQIEAAGSERSSAQTTLVTLVLATVLILLAAMVLAGRRRPRPAPARTRLDPAIVAGVRADAARRLRALRPVPRPICARRVGEGTGVPALPLAA